MEKGVQERGPPTLSSHLNVLFGSWVWFRDLTWTRSSSRSGSSSCSVTQDGNEPTPLHYEHRWVGVSGNEKNVKSRKSSRLQITRRRNTVQDVAPLVLWRQEYLESQLDSVRPFLHYCCTVLSKVLIPYGTHGTRGSPSHTSGINTLGSFRRTFFPGHPFPSH